MVCMHLGKKYEVGRLSWFSFKPTATFIFYTHTIMISDPKEAEKWNLCYGEVSVLRHMTSLRTRK